MTFIKLVQLLARPSGIPGMNINLKRSVILLLSVAGLVIISGCRLAERAQKPADLPAGWKEASLEHDGLTRWYRFYIPDQPTGKMPLILYLHGGTLSMRSLFSPLSDSTNSLLSLAEEESVFLLVPNGVNSESGDTFGDDQNWNDLRPDQAAGQSTIDDVGFLVTLLDLVIQENKIDPERVYVTGASNGGMMTFRLLIEAPEHFSAGAAFIANLPDLPLPLAPPSNPTPLMILNGSEDPLVLWDGGEVGKDRGRVLSTAETLSWWIDANQADPERVESSFLPDLDPDDNCQIQVDYYPAKPGGAAVLLYSAWGGGHTLPTLMETGWFTRLAERLLGPVCRDAEGMLLAWEFFNSH